MDRNIYPHLSIDATTNNEAKIQDNMLNLFQDDYKFNPNDVRLIEYLKRKIAGDPRIPSQILDVDIYKHSPDELERMYKHQEEKHMYYFSPRNKKYPKGKRPDRATGDFGFWKATGKENSLTSNNNNVVGSRMTLVYYKGNRKKAVKTNWIMQEYTIKKDDDNFASSSSSSSATPSDEMHLDDWVLCKIYEHNRKKKCQVTKQNQNKQEATISTKVVHETNHQYQNMHSLTPQYQPIKHFQVQHMQTSLSTNPILQFQLNTHMQTLSTNEVATLQYYQPNQHSKAPNMQASMDMGFIPQCQPNQHYNKAQASLSTTMNGIPQHQHNHHSQMQHMQSSPEYQLNQYSQTQMDHDFFDLLCQDIDFYN